MIRRDQLSDAERGAWERAWQREYKRLTRGGASLEDAKTEAREAARRVVELMRQGGQEPDFGRVRLPAEDRGAAKRERTERHHSRQWSRMRCAARGY